ncbi:hypothetical protein [Azonexus sp.]|uniref:hypothetical protein n=1 Tax=Azonexus sp. TaxID=1872668 RepID=UPI0027B96F30|nr:hypothetical protein [Azonexus sp.]
MMTEEMLKNMPHMMMNGASHVMAKPLTTGAMMAGAGFAAGKGLLGGALLRNPLTLLAVGAAGGVVAGFLLFKYQKEIIDGLSKATGMGKDFALHQKENLADLMAEAEEKIEGVKAPVATDIQSAA